jgi:hypothetical protein
MAGVPKASRNRRESKTLVEAGITPMDSFPVSALIVQSHPEASEVPLCIGISRADIHVSS